MKEKDTGNTVMVVGRGGREIALVRKYSQSPRVSKIIAIDGNDWMSKISEKFVDIHSDIKPAETFRIAKLCEQLGVDLVDVSQDSSVQAGLVDSLNLYKIPVAGPTREAGRIEWDKNSTRILGEVLGLPQPAYVSIQTEEQAKKFLELQKENTDWFVKASGLAEGKGAIPATSKKEVLDAIRTLKRDFSEAAETILIEEWLKGEEFSAFAISNGKSFKILGFAQDHKRECDGDKGENTGGMGAVSHPLLITPEIARQTGDIFRKVLIGRGTYRGVLFLGGIVVKGKVYVIEFNARWGDPEAQVIIPGLKVDLFSMGMATTKGSLAKMNISDDGKVRVVVVGAAKGYPRVKEYSQVKGKQIHGLDEAAKIQGVTISAPGVRIIGNKHYADGHGRIINVEGEGGNVLEAREKVDEAFERIKMEDNYLSRRTDIGWRDVERLRK
jgi:phosphoribosylamine---glycine ligase